MRSFPFWPESPSAQVLLFTAYPRSTLVAKVLRCGVVVVGVVLRTWVVAVALALPICAGAHEPVWSVTTTDGPQVESVTGAYASSRYLSLYHGSTYAPWSSPDLDGYRFRLVGGSGVYRDKESLLHATANAFAEALAGYQWSTPHVTAKAFAGIVGGGRVVTPSAYVRPEAEGALGWKVLGEGWVNVTRESFAQIDVGLGSLGMRARAQLRGGVRVSPSLALGPDIWIERRDERSGEVGVGGFVRYGWSGGEATLSAGWSADTHDDASPYVMLNVLTRR